MTGATIELILLIVTVIFSFFGALFGFLRWRAGLTFNVNDHEQILRERHEQTDRAYILPMPSEANSDVEMYAMELCNPTCISDTGWRYRIKSVIFGASGHTRATLRFSEVTETTSSGDPLRFHSEVPDVIENIMDHPWYEDLGVTMSPPLRGATITCLFNTTDPDEIESILSTLTRIIRQMLRSNHTDISYMIKVDDVPEDNSDEGRFIRIKGQLNNIKDNITDLR